MTIDLRILIANDAFAATFQSMAHYRQALLAASTEQKKISVLNPSLSIGGLQESGIPMNDRRGSDSSVERAVGRNKIADAQKVLDDHHAATIAQNSACTTSYIKTGDSKKPQFVEAKDLSTY